MVIIWLMMINNNLLGGFNLPTPLKKYESTSMGRMTYPIYMKWTIKFMFQSTKQLNWGNQSSMVLFVLNLPPYSSRS